MKKSKKQKQSKKGFKLSFPKFSDNIRLVVIIISCFVLVFSLDYLIRGRNDSAKGVDIVAREHTTSKQDSNHIVYGKQDNKDFIDVYVVRGKNTPYKLSIGKKRVSLSDDGKTIYIDVVFEESDGQIEGSPSKYLSVMLENNLDPGEYQVQANVTGHIWGNQTTYPAIKSTIKVEK